MNKSNSGLLQSGDGGNAPDSIASIASPTSRSSRMPPMQQEQEQKQQSSYTQDDLTRAQALLLSYLNQGQAPPPQQQHFPISTSSTQQSQFSQLQALEALMSSQQQHGSSDNQGLNASALSALFGGGSSPSLLPFQPIQQHQYQQTSRQQASAATPAGQPPQNQAQSQLSNTFLQSLMGYNVGGAAVATPSNSSHGSDLVNAVAQIGSLIGTEGNFFPRQSDSATQQLPNALQTALGSGNVRANTYQQNPLQSASSTNTQAGLTGDDDLLQALASLLKSQAPHSGPTPSPQSQLHTSCSFGAQQSQMQAQLQNQLLQQQLMQLIANTGSGQVPTHQGPRGQMPSLTGVNLLDYVNSATAIGNQSGKSSTQPADAEAALSSSNEASATAAVAAGERKAKLDHERQDLLANMPPMPAELQEMKKSKPRGRSSTFPRKLFQMLTELEQQSGGSAIASFLPHGKSFRIHKPKEFTRDIMPKYFQMGSFSSFQRQLNLYDFQRICDGPERDAYYHEQFVRDNPVLCTRIKRNKVKGLTRAKQEERLKNYEKGKKASAFSRLP